MSKNELVLKDKRELKEEKGETTYQYRVFVPDVDIYENDNELVLNAEMPGVKKENVSIDLKDGVVTIEGNINPKDYEGQKPIYSEYNIGNYRCRFAVKDVDCDKISAKMENGMLRLTLPKAEKAKPRKIAIK
ncbi:MAG: Hsp20/alpha crystallin family protein [Oligoflexales bacterium]|nr:Hsp20/alpha crystallin family protein [Oligoflexales bacterium]